MLDALNELGFAKVTIGKYSGFPGKSKRTTVKAGPKLIELIEEHKVTFDDLNADGEEEVIILKRPKRGHWDEGERVDYPETATTKRFRCELRAINAWLAKADIVLMLPPMIDQWMFKLGSYSVASHADGSIVAGGSSMAFGKHCRNLCGWEASVLKAKLLLNWTTLNSIQLLPTTSLKLSRRLRMRTRFQNLKSIGMA